MTTLQGLSWRGRLDGSRSSRVLGDDLAFVANAFADAGNPIAGTINATTVDNGNGTLTISVKGEWNWLTHNADCNDDRAGGVGIIWNDSTEPGWDREQGLGQRGRRHPDAACR